MLAKFHINRKRQMEYLRDLLSKSEVDNAQSSQMGIRQSWHDDFFAEDVHSEKTSLVIAMIISIFLSALISSESNMPLLTLFTLAITFLGLVRIFLSFTLSFSIMNSRQADGGLERAEHVSLTRKPILRLTTWVSYAYCFVLGCNLSFGFVYVDNNIILMLIYGWATAYCAAIAARNALFFRMTVMQILFMVTPVFFGLFWLDSHYYTLLQCGLVLGVYAAFKMAKSQLKHSIALRTQRDHVAKLAYINKQLTKTDAMTGFLNRFEFEELLEKQLSSQISTGHYLDDIDDDQLFVQDETIGNIIKKEIEACDAGYVGLIWVDIRNFARLNSAYCCSFGDAIICETASRLSHLGEHYNGGAFAEDILYCRYSADEFIMAVNCQNEREFSDFAKKICHHIQLPVKLNRRTIWLKIAMGTAFVEKQDQQAEDVLNKTHIALSNAKIMSYGNICHFTEEMQEEVQNRFVIERELHGADFENDLYLVYQPIIDMKLNKITAVEALARWRHPILGEVGAKDFIPIAENIGLIENITENVVKKACAEMRGWPDDVQLNINISPVILDREDIIEKIAFYVFLNKLNPKNIVLELTEELFIQVTDRVMENFRKMAQYGFTVALDDFCTGYRIFNYLTQMPVSTIKIDKSFVHNMGTAQNTRSIVHSILELGRNLGIKTIAEGIETQEQMHAIRNMGCDNVQGYYFSKPVRQLDFDQIQNDNVKKMPSLRSV